MSYFDHVRCSSCSATLDPESLGGGQGMACPSCGSELKLQDLFGVMEAFSEEDSPDLSLDDLVPGAPPQRARPSRPPPGGRPAPARNLPVKTDGGAPPSARDLMRQLKGRKK